MYRQISILESKTLVFWTVADCCAIGSCLAYRSRNHWSFIFWIRWL